MVCYISRARFIEKATESLHVFFEKVNQKAPLLFPITTSLMQLLTDYSKYTDKKNKKCSDAMHAAGIAEEHNWQWAAYIKHVWHWCHRIFEQINPTEGWIHSSWLAQHFQISVHSYVAMIAYRVLVHSSVSLPHRYPSYSGDSDRCWWSSVREQC